MPDWFASLCDLTPGPVILNVLCQRVLTSDSAVKYRLSTLLLLVTVAAFCAWGYFVALPAYRITQIKKCLEAPGGLRFFPAANTPIQVDSRLIDGTGGRDTAFMNGVTIKCGFVDVHADRALVSTGNTEALELYAEGNVVIKSKGATIKSDAAYLRTGPDCVIETDVDVEKDANNLAELQAKLHVVNHNLMLDEKN